MNRRVVEIAHKLYQARDAARLILGDRYAEEMAWRGEVIKAEAAAKKVSALDAAREMGRTLNDVPLVLLMAAVMELIEPTKPEAVEG